MEEYKKIMEDIKIKSALHLGIKEGLNFGMTSWVRILFQKSSHIILFCF